MKNVILPQYHILRNVTTKLEKLLFKYYNAAYRMCGIK